MKKLCSKTTQRSRAKKKKYKVRKTRSCLGMYMIEVLIALSLGALMCFVLLDTLSSGARLVSSGQNQATANSILLELLEWTKAAGYNYLQGMPSENEITVNRSMANEPGSDTGIRDEVALLDDFTLSWSDLAKRNSFSGKIKYSILPFTEPNSLKVSIRVAWTDSSSFAPNSASSLGAGREIFASTIVRKGGSEAYF